MPDESQRADEPASAALATPVAPAAPKSRGRRALMRLFASALGLVIGLAAAEGAFYARDQGAFPHLNTYVNDDNLGVRLRPGATQRIAFSGNPVTRVRINSDGFRGPELT